MIIKVLKSCWTPSPEGNWIEGEEVEVSEEVGEKLLQNKNFVKASAKPEAESEEKENEFGNRKKRSIRNRA